MERDEVDSFKKILIMTKEVWKLKKIGESQSFEGNNMRKSCANTRSLMFQFPYGFLIINPSILL